MIQEFNVYEYSTYGCIECPNHDNCNNDFDKALDAYVDNEIENEKLDEMTNDNFTNSDLKEMFNEHFPD
jgi:hypothetical protein